ncbi:MAG: hypothetical protein JNJ57_11795, partial [Saprospiraceae bacterium]|nr:hypothetical protein [Saprospiraceae bacterium]
MINNEQNNPFPFTAAYFSSLTIGNVKCFKENQTLNLTANNGKPARWTVILGNNNTGKTTLLKCLAALEPKEASLIIGEEDSTLQELQNGKKKSMTVKASWPSYLLPNFLFRDFNGLNSSTLRCDFLLSKAESNQLSSKDFTSFNQFANTNWGGAFEGGKGASMEGGDARFSNFIPLFSYGASRIMSRKALSETINRHPHGSLFENRFIPNVEDWLLGLFLAAKLGKEKADSDLNFATEILKSGILPDVKDLELDSIEKENGFENFVHFLTDY